MCLKIGTSREEGNFAGVSEWKKNKFFKQTVFVLWSVIEVGWLHFSEYYYHKKTLVPTNEITSWGPVWVTTLCIFCWSRYCKKNLRIETANITINKPCWRCYCAWNENKIVVVWMRVFAKTWPIHSRGWEGKQGLTGQRDRGKKRGKLKILQKKKTQQIKWRKTRSEETKS